MPTLPPARSSFLRRLAGASALALLAVSGCSDAVGAIVPPGAPTADAAEPAAGDAAASRPSRDRLTVTLSGDLLWHNGLIREGAAAGRKVGRAYDFEPVFAHVRPLIAGADVSVCHVEAPIAPVGVKPRGYPTFAAPAETIRAVKAAGFDYCTTASNHTFDQGTAGVARTLGVLDAAGIRHTGSYRTERESTEPSILTTASGIKVAVIAGTYGLNGRGPGASRAWAYDKLDPADMIARGRAARRAGADVVLAAMHAGTEHRALPNAQQTRVARALATSKVFDVVYGHHAHVPQAWDRIGDTWVMYGGGNFVGQMRVATPRAYEEYVGRFTLERRGGRFVPVKAEYIPLLMTVGRPGAPARVLQVNRALAERTGDAARLRVAKQQIARAVRLLGVRGLVEG